MSFQIRPLPQSTFAPLFLLDAAQLTARGIERQFVREADGTPCRVGLCDAPVGAEVLLLPYLHQPTDGPYRASGPIFVARDSATAAPAVGEVPRVLARRLLSVRAYDEADRIVQAEVIDGREAAPLFHALLSNDGVAYLHVHFARQGCYACRVDRVR